MNDLYFRSLLRPVTRRALSLSSRVLPLTSRVSPGWLTSTHLLETYWCDSSGTFVEGWAFVHQAASTRVEVRCGRTTVTATTMERTDLAPFFPGMDHALTSGFSAYIPGTPQGSVVLTLHTERGAREVHIELPDHPVPPLEKFDDTISPYEMLRPYLDDLPAGPVLMVGQRRPTEPEWLESIEWIKDCHREVLGLDIHPGFGADIIGDAHRMSSHVEPGSVAVVVSASVLEHVTTPWLIAVETAKVLAEGGISLMLAPWSWPTHAMPNDFWRFSPEGLSLLFGPELGFETLAVGGTGGIAMMPQPAWRDQVLKMPTTASNAMSWIVSRKVAEPDPAIHWPYDPDQGLAAARNYPAAGLAHTDPRIIPS